MVSQHRNRQCLTVSKIATTFLSSPLGNVTLGGQQDDNSTQEVPHLASSIGFSGQLAVVDVAYIEEETIVPTEELRTLDLKNESIGSLNNQLSYPDLVDLPDRIIIDTNGGEPIVIEDDESDSDEDTPLDRLTCGQHVRQCATAVEEKKKLDAVHAQAVEIEAKWLKVQQGAAKLRKIRHVSRFSLITKVFNMIATTMKQMEEDCSTQRGYSILKKGVVKMKQHCDRYSKRLYSKKASELLSKTEITRLRRFIKSVDKLYLRISLERLDANNLTG